MPFWSPFGFISPTILGGGAVPASAPVTAAPKPRPKPFKTITSEALLPPPLSISPMIALDTPKPPAATIATTAPSPPSPADAGLVVPGAEGPGSIPKATTTDKKAQEILRNIYSEEEELIPKDETESARALRLAREETRKQRRLSKGRMSTILTGPRGLLGTARVSRKTLIGK